MNGHNVTSIKLLGTTCVTDAGIVSLISSAPHLKQFVLENAGTGVVGTLVPAILQLCRQLETLHIEGAEGVNWSELHLSGAWWRVLQQPHAQLPSAAAGTGSCGQAAAAVIGSTSSGSIPPAQQGFSQDVDPSSTSADGSLQLDGRHQRRHHRVSSDISDSPSDIESDDGSVSAASDATSISVPAAATAALAAQLLHTSLQAGSSGGGTVANAGTSSSRQSLSQIHLQQQQQQQAMDAFALQVSQPPHQLQQQQQAVPCHSALRKLHVRFANVDNLVQLIERCPGLTELHVDGPAFNIQAAVAACPNIKRLAFLVGTPLELDAALFYLNNMSNLRGLELEIKGMMLSTEQLRVSMAAGSSNSVYWHLVLRAVHAIRLNEVVPMGLALHVFQQLVMLLFKL